MISNSPRLKQYICINTYCTNNKRNFKRFLYLLINSDIEEYDNINDVYALVHENNLCTYSTMEPNRSIQKESKKYYKYYKKNIKEEILC